MAIKIFIDQGHNPSGFNAGAEGFGLREQDITYNVGIYLADILRKDGRFSVLTSRTTPTQILGYTKTTSLRERVSLATEWGADYFLSIHVNSNTNPDINGSEVYVYREKSAAYYLGESILNSIVQLVGTKNNGIIINKSFYVLKKTPMPSALIELAYISNYSDAEKLRNNQYEFANAIYVGLINYMF